MIQLKLSKIYNSVLLAIVVIFQFTGKDILIHGAQCNLSTVHLNSMDRDSAVVVDDYSELQCAVQMNTPVIYVNESIIFDETISIKNARSMIFIGGPFVELISGAAGVGLFQISSSNITFSNITLRGYSDAGMAVTWIEHGSLLYAVGSDLNTQNVTMINGATACGGAIYGLNSTFNVDQCLFHDNNISKALADQCTNMGAGALMMDGSSLYITHSKLFNNAGVEGGAISLMQSNLAISGSIINANVASNGGAIYSQRSMLALEIFQCASNVVESNGGCLYISDNSSIVAVDSDFYNCVADYGGAVYVADASSVLLNAVSINGNYARYGGGGVDCSGHSKLVAYNGSQFNDNTAVLLGGALRATTLCDVEIVDTHFLGNFIGGILSVVNPIAFGGAVFCASSASLWISRTNISSSKASEGAAIYMFSCTVNMSDSKVEKSLARNAAVSSTDNASLIVTDTTFSENYASENAAAVSCVRTQKCSFLNSAFASNFAEVDGTLYVFSSVATISNCTFILNIADANGGAIFGTDESYITVSASSFRNNSAQTLGGAIFLRHNSSVSVEGSLFQFNHANSGGSFYATDECSGTINRTYFSSNKADNYGGAISISEKCEFVLQNLSFYHNIAVSGGAAYVAGYSNATVQHLMAYDNEAHFSGAVFFVYDSATLYIHSSSLYSNQALSGGAVSAVYESTVRIDNSSLLYNSASDYGGAIYITASCAAYVSDTLLESNIAALGGGVYYVESSELSCVRCFAYYNSAVMGGVAFVVNSRAIVTNSTFSYNGDSIVSNSGLKVTSGGAFYISLFSHLLSDGCSYFYNQAEAGGAIYSSVSIVESTKDVFGFNSALRGGCLCGSENSTLIIIGGLLQNNTAVQGQVGPVINMVGGLLSMADTIVQFNSAFAFGTISIYSASLLVRGGEFKHNTITGSGSCLYLAAADSSSVLNTTVSADILASVFYSNSAINGVGGVILVNSYTGKVEINQCSFTSNTAIFGGAVASVWSAVNVTQSVFSKNRAQGGGGGLFWVVDIDHPENQLLFDNFTEARSSENIAAYGPLVASDLRSLDVSSVDDIYFTSSGDYISAPLRVSLLDNYGQLITNSSTTLLSEALSVDTVFCSIASTATGTVTGSVIVEASHGIAEFEQIVVSGYPGGSTVLQFDVSVPSVSAIFVDLNFSTCISGQIIVDDSNDGSTGSCVTCGKGTYSFYPTDEECKTCPSHTSCEGGNVLKLNNRYWRSNQMSDHILECWIPGACKGGTNTSSQCHKGSHGPYCSICDDGYTSSGGGLCYSCENNTNLLQEVLSSILFLSAVVIILVLVKKRKQISRYVSKKFDDVNTGVKFRTARVKIKILIAFVQILMELGPALNIVWPVNYTRYINYYAIFAMNLTLIPNAGCIIKTNYYTSLLINTVSPFVVFFVIAGVLQLVVFHAKRLNKRRPFYTSETAKRNTVGVAFFISYLVLVGVSTTVFQAFKCESFDNGEMRRLVADYSIDCRSDDRRFYVLYAIVMIFVYPIGIPVVYAVVLIKNRKLINPNWRLVIDSSEKKLVNMKVLQRGKIKIRKTYEELKNVRTLFDNYVPKRWYFELFDCARRLFLGAIPVLVDRGSVLQIIFVLLISLFSVAILMRFSPYIHGQDNNLAVVAQWSITLVVISSLIIRVSSTGAGDDVNDEILGGILIALNIIVIGMAVGSIAMSAKPSTDPTDVNAFFDDDEDEDEDDGELDDEDDLIFATENLEGNAKNLNKGASDDSNQQDFPVALCVNDIEKSRVDGLSDGMELTTMNKAFRDLSSIARQNDKTSTAPIKGATGLSASSPMHTREMESAHSGTTINDLADSDDEYD